MFTMMDQIFDRTYQSGRAELNAGIDRGLSRIVNMAVTSFEALHRSQWNAPWLRNSRDAGCA